MCRTLTNSVANAFSFIGPEHAFYVHVQRFKTLLLTEQTYTEMLERYSARGQTEVRSLMRAQFQPGHGWGLKRFYLSFQSPGELRRVPFHALTLFYSANKNRIECYEFPRDPSLTALVSFFDENPHRQNKEETAAGWTVLRYIPRRRLTFRTAADD